MKVLMYILIVIGLLLLLGAVVGRLIGDPNALLGRSVRNLMVDADTVFLLAILVKLFEKK